MIIRKLSHNTYDVFGGIGWPNADAVPHASNAQWTRIKRFHWGMKQISGTFLSRSLLQYVIEAIQAHPEGSLENI